jgi:hypothetical protein
MTVIVTHTCVIDRRRLGWKGFKKISAGALSATLAYACS